MVSDKTPVTVSHCDRFSQEKGVAYKVQDMGARATKMHPIKA